MKTWMICNAYAMNVTAQNIQTLLIQYLSATWI